MQEQFDKIKWLIKKRKKRKENTAQWHASHASTNSKYFSPLIRDKKYFYKKIYLKRRKHFEESSKAQNVTSRRNNW